MLALLLLLFMTVVFGCSLIRKWRQQYFSQYSHNAVRVECWQIEFDSSNAYAVLLRPDI